MERGVFLYLIPALVFFALLYFMWPFFSPPQPEFWQAPLPHQEPECVPGSEPSCITRDGCYGNRPCVLGKLGGCVKDFECTPGDSEPCAYSSCVQGRRECDSCGKWGMCVPPPGCEIGYCPVGDQTN